MQSINRISNNTSAQPWYKHRWPWLLMLGPFVVVVAGIITGWLAYTNQDALVVDDYYKQGKTINQDLRRERVAASMKLEATLRYEPDGGKLVGTIASHSQPLPAKLFITLVHSTQPGKDLTLNAQSDQEGRFTVGLPMLDMARWQIVIEGEQRDWRLGATWAWPQQRSVELKAGAD
jgi:uncharacterized protein